MAGIETGAQVEPRYGRRGGAREAAFDASLSARRAAVPAPPASSNKGKRRSGWVKLARVPLNITWSRKNEPPVPMTAVLGATSTGSFYVWDAGTNSYQPSIPKSVTAFRGRDRQAYVAIEGDDVFYEGFASVEGKRGSFKNPTPIVFNRTTGNVLVSKNQAERNGIFLASPQLDGSVLAAALDQQAAKGKGTSPEAAKAGEEGNAAGAAPPRDGGESGGAVTTHDGEGSGGGGISMEDFGIGAAVTAIVVGGAGLAKTLAAKYAAASTLTAVAGSNAAASTTAAAEQGAAIAGEQVETMTDIGRRAVEQASDLGARSAETARRGLTEPFVKAWDKTRELARKTADMFTDPFNMNGGGELAYPQGTGLLGAVDNVALDGTAQMSGTPNSGSKISWSKFAGGPLSPEDVQLTRQLLKREIENLKGGARKTLVTRLQELRTHVRGFPRSNLNQKIKEKKKFLMEAKDLVGNYLAWPPFTSTLEGTRVLYHNIVNMWDELAGMDHLLDRNNAPFDKWPATHRQMYGDRIKRAMVSARNLDAILSLIDTIDVGL